MKSAPAIRLISVTKDGWGKEMKMSLSALAADLLPIGEPCDYWFTGKSHPHLNKGDILVFRFKGQVLGEGRFSRWVDEEDKHMEYVPIRQYLVRVAASAYLSPGRNPYPFIKPSELKTMRKDGMDDGNGPYATTGEKEALTKHRIGQGQVRASALDRYGSRCCLCPIDEPSVLVAGHIRGWAKGKKARGNPANVILMCAFHDSLFGRGLITLHPRNYKVRFAKKRLSEGALRQAKRFTRVFRQPGTNSPGSAFLAWHRAKVFVE